MLRSPSPRWTFHPFFQSSSATKADATRLSSQSRATTSAFNPHPPRRRMLRAVVATARFVDGLSILIRHEGGCYGSGACSATVIETFQSSSATKADATRGIGRRLHNHNLSILIRHEGGCYPASSSPQPAARPFNPHPPRRRMLLRERVPQEPRRVLSILIRHEGGCYPALACIWRQRVSFNPHPPRRRMLPNNLDLTQCRVPFQSSSATKADATRLGAVSRPGQGLSILIRHEGGCYFDVAEEIFAEISFQSSSATKADATAISSF